jgi:hypothetical protein
VRSDCIDADAETSSNLLVRQSVTYQLENTQFSLGQLWIMELDGAGGLGGPWIRSSDEGERLASKAKLVAVPEWMLMDQASVDVATVSALAVNQYPLTVALGDRGVNPRDLHILPHDDIVGFVTTQAHPVSTETYPVPLAI